MPWKEACVVNVRGEFVLRSLRQEVPFTVLCREYGISTKTGYKWKERFLKNGCEGLHDQSRRPHASPGQLGDLQVCGLVRLKLAHRTWGPKKIREVFSRAHPGEEIPSLSTVKRVLAKAGLVVHRPRRGQKECGRIENHVDPEAPNQLWTVDFKGWWYSAERERIEPLTVRDAYSRYALCARIVENGKSETVRREFQRLFEVYGLPEAIRSDNGSPFACTSAPLGLSRLSAWWVTVGIALDRIVPGHPEQNGAHERMHRDMAMEVEYGAGGDLREQQAALEVWRNEFNEERPHEALGMRVPAELYVKSSRRFRPGPVELTYPLGYLRRKVGRRGRIRIENIGVDISVAVGGYEVGLKPTGRGKYAVWFGPLCLGEIDLATQSFRAARWSGKGPSEESGRGLV